MTQNQAVAVTPNANEPYHNGEDAEKAVAVGAPTFKDEGLEGPPRKRFLFWSLTKKQWIYALIGTIVGVIGIFLLIFFLAIVPAIFQKQVDKVQLTLNHLDLLKMSPDRSSNDITVEMSAHIVSDAMSAATMYETEMDLSYKGMTFGRVTVPKTKLKKGKYEFDLVIKGPTKVIDQRAFREVSKAVVTEETLEVEVSAKVKIHAMGLSQGGLDLKRKVKVKGLNQFSDPASKITGITPDCSDKNVFKMMTNITMINDSNIGLDGIGVLNMTVYHGTEYIGQAIATEETGARGIPRGTDPSQFMLTVVKEQPRLKALGGLLRAILANNAQFYITGESPYAVSQAILLDESLTKLNMSVLYTDGLSKINLDTVKCAELLALAVGS